MTRKATAKSERLEKVLARPLVQAGVLREPGDTVTLTPAQVERLAAEGYFTDAGNTESKHDDKLSS